MRLLTVRLGGFQSYYEPQTLRLDPHLTLLVGRNDVGKSAILRALRAVGEPQHGARPDFMLAIELLLERSDVYGLNLSAEAHDDEHDVERIRMALGRYDQVKVNCELGWNAPINQMLTRNDMFVRQATIERVGRIDRSGPSNQLIWTDWSIDDEIPAPTSTGGIHRILLDCMALIKYLAPRREAITGFGSDGRSTFQYETTLRSDGTNLTNVIAYLALNWIDIWEEVQELVIAAFPSVRRVEARTFGQQSGSLVHAELHVAYRDGRVVPLKLCGTGLEQLLIVATGVLSDVEQRVFLIDEPHAHLHPHAERALLRFIEHHPQHQYVVATHSGVFINSVPISRTRFVYQEMAESRISIIDRATSVLGDLGFTAADLWMADSLIFVEGSTEEALLTLVLKSTLELPDRSVRVRAMPMPSRFSSRSRQTSRSAFEFCQSIVEATAPVPVRTRFLFDRDEKSAQVLADIETASRHQAMFLPVREIENFLLDAETIGVALAERASNLDIEPPTQSAVERLLSDCFADVNNRRLFARPPQGDEDPTNVIAGSRVLRRMYEELLNVGFRTLARG